MNKIFPELPSPKMHPANVGHDFNRTYGMTEKLKNLHIARGVKLTIFRGDYKHVMSELRTLFYIGAKFVSSAAAPKVCGDWDIRLGEWMKFYINLAHSVDPELIFDAYISSEIDYGVGYIDIPEYVFEAFGLPTENRKFNYASMTDLERKMWYFYRGMQFIAAGFESLTFDNEIPKDVTDMFKDKALMVFRGELDLPCLATVNPDTIKNVWIAQKQNER